MTTKTTPYTLALLALGATQLGFESEGFGHGLIQDPPSRNWFCGAITKPDQTANGTAEYPICAEAFTAPGIDFTEGYSFMSVLTHTTGRAGIGPRDNVCGFDSETWNGRATVWDQPIDWPTNNITAGEQVFTWNISWGPHFDDTSDFRYWITKPDFQYEVGRPLSFDDFESQPFCNLAYNNDTPQANPNVIPDPASATFQTKCTVPARTGRHVIYAEWGREPPTFERFHGCVDVVFDGGGQPPLDAQILFTPSVAEVQGAGTITLDARNSIGPNLTYSWSVDAPDPSLYSITNADQAVATLNLAEPQAASTVTVSLVVRSGTRSDSATRTLLHRPASNSQWVDLGALTPDPRTLVVGDRVSIRTVSNTGQDAFYPTTPVVITATNNGANDWPLAVAQAVNAGAAPIRVGVLNAQDQVVAEQSATTNRVYALATSNIASAFLQVEPATTSDGVTVEPVVASNGPWFNAQQVKISNTTPLTALSVTIVIQRTAGVTHNGQYNTVGGSVEQSRLSSASELTYMFTLQSGSSIGVGTDRLFVAQTGGSGSVHPTAGDTYTVTYTTGGVTRTQSGNF